MITAIENIEIFDPAGGSLGLFPVTDKCERSAKLMGEDYVKLSFNMTQRVIFAAFSYIIYDGQYFFLKEVYRPTPQGSHYQYEFKFSSIANMLSKSLFFRYYQIPEGNGYRDVQPEPNFDMNGSIDELATIAIRSIQGAATRVPKFNGSTNKYAQLIAGIQKGEILTDTRLNTYSFESNYIADALTMIAESYDTEWWIKEDGNTLHLQLCKCEKKVTVNNQTVLETPVELSDIETYHPNGLHAYTSNGLKSCEYAQEWSNIPQHILPYGSERNIVRKQALDNLNDKDVYVSYGKRLRLSPNTTYTVKDKNGNNVSLITDSLGAVNNDGVTSGIEKTEIFDDIYPQGHFIVTAVEQNNSGIFTITAQAVKPNADGTPMKDGNDYVLYSATEAVTYHILPIENKEQTEDLTIIFESGYLNGREFGIARKQEPIYTGNTLTSCVFKCQIVPDAGDDDSLKLPQGNFIPKVGDMFAIFNMDMPDGYVTMAEQRLAQATYEKLQEYQASRPDVKCKADPEYFMSQEVKIGKRFSVYSELFGTLQFTDGSTYSINAQDTHTLADIDRNNSTVFTSRVTAFSHTLTKPDEVQFTLASGTVAGTLAAMQAAIGEQTSDIRGLEQKQINLSMRGWHDANEMKDMLQTLVAEMMLVGNEKYQFAFTMGIQCEDYAVGESGNTRGIVCFKELYITAGTIKHTQKPYTDYSNGGEWTAPEVHLSRDANNVVLDPEKAYYLYAVCSDGVDRLNTTDFKLIAKDDSVNDPTQREEYTNPEYVNYMLLGILSSEFFETLNGVSTSKRVFNRSNGYTQITGGTITTEQIQDPTRSLIIDFASNPPRIIAKNGAKIIGNIEFELANDANYQQTLQRLGLVEEFADNLTIGGRNLLRDTAFIKKGANLVGWVYAGPSGGSIKTHADENAIDDGAVRVVLANGGILQLSHTGATGAIKVGDIYTFSAQVKADASRTMTFSPYGGQGSASVSVGTSYKSIKLTCEVTRVSNNLFSISCGMTGTLYIKNAMLENGNVATSWTQAPEDIAEEVIENKNYVDNVVGSLETDLQHQIDGAVESFFLPGVPTMSNTPVSDWEASDYDRHKGDTYTNIRKHNTESDKLLDVANWEQGRVWYGTNYINKTFEQCKSASGDAHQQGVRYNGLLKYESGDTLWLNTNGGEYDILITYFAVEGSNTVQKASTYYSGSSNTTAKEIVLNASYTLCNISIRKNTTVTTDIVTGKEIAINPKAGHSWRFCNSEGAWHWHEIADSDAVLALQKAAEAQDTADGKRRVFSTADDVLPKPPYDAGDLWANAKYAPYDDVLLKCVKSRAKDETPLIADWVDSSRAITAADNARIAADDAMQKAQDIANDGIISGGTEKATLKKEWMEIAGSNLNGTGNGSYYKACQQARAYNLNSDATYQDLTQKVNALYSAMNTILTNMNADTYLKGVNAPTGASKLNYTRDEFNALWRNYYDAEIALLNKVQDVVDGHAGAAAQAAADAAADAEASLQVLGDMAADSKLTPQEKVNVKREWDEIAAEYDINTAQAAKYGVATGTYTNKKEELRIYLLGTYTKSGDVTTAGLLVDMSRTETINPTTFKDKFKAYYKSNIDLLNAISDAINANGGETGENLIGEANPYKIDVSSTSNYNWKPLVGAYPSQKAINQNWLENGKKYTFCVDKVTNFGFSATQFSVGLYNGSTTQLVTLDIKDGRQTHTFTVPDDGANWGLIIYPAVAGSTQYKGANFYNLALYEGEKASNYYKSYVKHLTDAMKGTTDVAGGLVMTNVMMLKDEQGNVQAGMSGLVEDDENVAMWAGGTYLQALEAAGGTDNALPVLLTKNGLKSRIGCFRVVDKDTVSVKTDNNEIFISNKGLSTIAPITTSQSGSASISYNSGNIYPIGSGTSGTKSADISQTFVALNKSFTKGNYQVTSAAVTFIIKLYSQAVRGSSNNWIRTAGGLSSVEMYVKVAGVEVGHVTLASNKTSDSTAYASAQAYGTNTTSIDVPLTSKTISFSCDKTSTVVVGFRLTGSYTMTAGGSGSSYGRMYIDSTSVTVSSKQTDKYVVLAKDGIAIINSSDAAFYVKNSNGSLDVRATGLPTSEPSNPGQLWKKTIYYKNASGNTENSTVVCIK